MGVGMIVDDAYFDWLCEQVDYYEGDDHDILVTVLFNTCFDWFIANDDNRAADGLELRTIFMDREGWNSEPLEGYDCNCFELFVALAKRIEDDIMWDGEQNRTAQWFWIMMRNMGLYQIRDGCTDAYGKIQDILERFIDREYDSDGFGGPFPLRGEVDFDARETELWYQMQLYLTENYEF